MLITILDGEVADGYASTLDRLAHDFLWIGGHSGQAVFGDGFLRAYFLQPAAPERRFPREAAVHRRQRWKAGGTIRDGQGLRVRQGPVRHVQSRGVEGP